MPVENETRPPFSDTLVSWVLYCTAIGGAAAILKLTSTRGGLVAGAGLVAAVVFVLGMIIVAGRVSRSRRRG